MHQEEEISQEEQIKRSYYNLVGQWNIPIVHAGGLKATDELLEMCRTNEKSNLLDVGCGSGFTACQIAKKYNCHVVGIDISETMVARSKERARKENLTKVEFQVADVTQLPFEDQSFDVVIMESFLNILGKADIIKRALDEISRVTKSGGRVGANELFADESTPPELLERIRELLKNATGPGQGLAQYTPTEFKKFFEDAGLHVTQMVKKPQMSVAKDTIKVMGLIGFTRFSIRAIYGIITNPELREGTRRAAPAKAIMERRKDTKKFFGYILIVAQKPE